MIDAYWHIVDIRIFKPEMTKLERQRFRSRFQSFKKRRFYLVLGQDFSIRSRAYICFLGMKYDFGKLKYGHDGMKYGFDGMKYGLTGCEVRCTLTYPQGLPPSRHRQELRAGVCAARARQFVSR